LSAIPKKQEQLSRQLKTTIRGSGTTVAIGGRGFAHEHFGSAVSLIPEHVAMAAFSLRTDNLEEIAA